jgi:hypothetical protein
MTYFQSYTSRLREAGLPCCFSTELVGGAWNGLLACIKRFAERKKRRGVVGRLRATRRRRGAGWVARGGGGGHGGPARLWRQALVEAGEPTCGGAGGGGVRLAAGARGEGRRGGLGVEVERAWRRARAARGGRAGAGLRRGARGDERRGGRGVEAGRARHRQGYGGGRAQRGCG